ncbi:inorganic diphosphatase [Pedobacter faecalis]|uniref:inorganic diphosphatase n=1 Tax=Pedobacter faecalis TaxID=3041495 RepID=UPI00254FC63E|nr:inorganic diphosphatase [Pedobacter sp. ELA7]
MEETVTAIVETPRGSAHKYDFDPGSGSIKLKKVMPAGLVFPFDFGFLPGTVGGDGDPMDVLLISELACFPGCAVDCRIIGGLLAEQTERDGTVMTNDRVIAVPVVSATYSSVTRLSDLPKGMLNEIEEFFKNYNAQAGKVFKVKRRISAAQALALVEKSRDQLELTLLFEIFLPLKDNAGRAFPERVYSNLQKQLVKKFGGVTMYTRSPAQGLWDTGRSREQKDDLVIFEVMAAVYDEAFWKNLKEELEENLGQEEILIRSSKAQTVR